MKNKYNDQNKELVKELYAKMDTFNEVEKAEALKTIKEIREAEEGKALFSADIQEQINLASVLGLKFPEKK